MKKNFKQKNNFYLKRGDIIDIIAPGSACSEENFKLAVEWLRAKGFKPRWSKDVIKPEMYLAQSDKYRFDDLKKALSAQDSMAIWCLRGGYGSFRLWPDLLKLKKKYPAKLFIGLSDITSLHHFLNRKWKWPTLHASLLDRVGQNKLSAGNESELFSVLFGETQAVEFNHLVALNAAAKKKKKINGTVLGGNLATYMVALGTDLHPKYKKNENVILFFEDIGERGYKVDRFLNHLIQAKVLDQVAAVVFGDFIQGQESNGNDLTEKTLINFAQKIKIPVFTGLEAGHADLQRPVFFGTEAELTCGVNPQMVVYSP